MCKDEGVLQYETDHNITNRLIIERPAGKEVRGGEYVIGSHTMTQQSPLFPDLEVNAATVSGVCDGKTYHDKRTVFCKSAVNYSQRNIKYQVKYRIINNESSRDM